jgi:hypothetical protein
MCADADFGNRNGGHRAGRHGRVFMTSGSTVREQRPHLEPPSDAAMRALLSGFYFLEQGIHSTVHGRMDIALVGAAR